MLLQNPQLAYALLQAQVVMRIVDPEIALVCMILFLRLGLMRMLVWKSGFQEWPCLVGALTTSFSSIICP